MIFCPKMESKQNFSFHLRLINKTFHRTKKLAKISQQRKEKIRTAFKNFANHLDIPGPREIRESENKIECFFWSLAFVFACVIPIFIVWNLIETFRQFPVSTEIKIVSSNDGDMLQELIHLVYCPTDWVNTSKIKVLQN